MPTGILDLAGEDSFHSPPVQPLERRSPLSILMKEGIGLGLLFYGGGPANWRPLIKIVPAVSLGGSKINVGSKQRGQRGKWLSGILANVFPAKV